MVTLLRAMSLTGGEWVIYILILCSVLTLGIVIERWIVLSREKKNLQHVRELFEKSLEENKIHTLADALKQYPGLPAKILMSGLMHSKRGALVVEEHLSSATFGEKKRLETRMVVLGTLGNNAVYIGLFGTVLGVIKAFHDLSQDSAGSGPEVVMKGLSEALLATAVGLLVALPSVIAYNIFQKQIKDILSETESMTRLLIAQMKSDS